MLCLPALSPGLPPLWPVQILLLFQAPPPQVPSSRQPSCCLLPLCSRPQFSEAAMPKNCSLGLLRCPGMLSGEGSLEEVRGVCGKMMGAGRGGY